MAATSSHRLGRLVLRAMALPAGRLTHWLLLAGFACSPLGAQAVGFGALRVDSALGQPLRLSVPLRGLEEFDPAHPCVKVQVGAPDGSTSVRTSLQFVRAQEQLLLKILSSQDVNEPALTVSIKVQCSTPAQRDYQILLDLPAALQAETEPAASAAAASMPASVAPPVSAPAAVTSSPRRASRSSSAAANVPATASVAEPPARASQPRTTARPDKSARSVLRLSAPEDAPVPAIDAGLRLSYTLTLPGEATPADIEAARRRQARLMAELRDEDYFRTLESALSALETDSRKLRAELQRLQKEGRAEQQAAALARERLQLMFYGVVGLLVLALVALLWSRSRPFIAGPITLGSTGSSATDLGTSDLGTTETGASDASALIANAQEAAPQRAGEAEAEMQDAFAAVAVAPSPRRESLLRRLLRPRITRPFAWLPQEQNADAPEQTSIDADDRVNDGADQGAQKLAKPAAGDSNNNERGARARMAFATGTSSSPDKSVALAPAPGTREHAKSTADAGLDFHFSGEELRSPPPAPAKSNPDEISDLLELAEAWLSLKQPETVIEILGSFRDMERPSSPVPWLCLMSAYSACGDSENYASLAGRLKRLFNVDAPDWATLHDPNQARKTLADFPHVKNRILELWDSPELLPYLDSLLPDKRNGERIGFPLSVYQDIVQLMRLARDPAQRGQAAPILPTQVAQMLQVQPPSIETAEAGAETVQTSPPSQNGDMPSRGWQLLP